MPGTKYQQMARRCLLAAKRLRDPTQRLNMLEVAGGYMALARHVNNRPDRSTVNRSAERKPARRPNAA